MVGVGRISEGLRRPLVAPFSWTKMDVVSSMAIAPGREDVDDGYLDGPVLEAFTGGAALGYDHGYGGEVSYLGVGPRPRLHRGVRRGDSRVDRRLLFPILPKRTLADGVPESLGFDFLLYLPLQ